MEMETNEKLLDIEIHTKKNKLGMNQVKQQLVTPRYQHKHKYNI